MFKDTDPFDQDLDRKNKKELVLTLQDIISELDEDGIQFLIHQARVLQYNKQVREINKKVATSKSGRADEVSQRSEKQHAIEIVERGDGKHFFIVVRGFRIYFTLEEMKKLVKICHVARNAADATERLYNWLKRFRSDFLVDGDIGSAGNPYLDVLYKKLISTYKLREDE